MAFEENPPDYLIMVNFHFQTNATNVLFSFHLVYSMGLFSFFDLKNVFSSFNNVSQPCLLDLKNVLNWSKMDFSFQMSTPACLLVHHVFFFIFSFSFWHLLVGRLSAVGYFSPCLKKEKIFPNRTNLGKIALSWCTADGIVFIVIKCANLAPTTNQVNFDQCTGLEQFHLVKGNKKIKQNFLLPGASVSCI